MFLKKGKRLNFSTNCATTSSKYELKTKALVQLIKYLNFETKTDFTICDVFLFGVRGKK